VIPKVNTRDGTLILQHCAHTTAAACATAVAIRGFHQALHAKPAGSFEQLTSTPRIKKCSRVMYGIRIFVTVTRKALDSFQFSEVYFILLHPFATGSSIFLMKSLLQRSAP
jgi:hypothetical protein